MIGSEVRWPRSFNSGAFVEEREMVEVKRGEFWLAGNDGERVAGVLTYGSDGSSLDLSGQLEDLFSSRGRRTIHGLLEGGMQCVTLQECYMVSGTGFRGHPGAVQNYSCNAVLLGQFIFSEGEDVTAEYFVVSMSPLTEWLVGKDLVRVDDLRSREGGNRAVEVLADECRVVEECRSDGQLFNLEMWRSANARWGRNEKGSWLVAEPRSWVKIVPVAGPVSLDVVHSLVYKLRMMLTMFANRVAVVNWVRFRAVVDNGECPDWHRDIELYKDWNGYSFSEDMEARGVGRLGVVLGDNVGDGAVREWFNLCDDFHPAVAWLLSFYFNRGVPLDMAFDAAFKAVERFLSQHFGPGRSGRPGGYGRGEARASISSLVAFVNNTGVRGLRPFKDMDTDALTDWATRIMEMRDKSTSHLDWGSGLMVPEPEEFYREGWLLTFVGIAFLMQQMGIEDSVIAEMLDRRIVRRLP